MNLLDFSKEQRVVMAHKWDFWICEYYQKDIDHAVANTTRCQNNVPPTKDATDKKTESFLVDMDSVSCLFHFQEPGHKVAILNYASYKNPGGMFLNGSPAQEEALCHQSTLYPVLCGFKDSYYDPHLKTLNRGLYTDDALYSKDVRFFNYDLEDRTGKFVWHQHETVYADVITCAAPNIKTYTRYNDATYLSDECMNAICSRIITVLNTAVEGGCEDLILGAFGCGVFGNDPITVADYFMDYIADNFQGKFRKVYYAIPKSKSNKNYEAFKEVAKCQEYGVTELQINN